MIETALDRVRIALPPRSRAPAPAADATPPELPPDNPAAIRALLVERGLFAPGDEVVVTLLTGGVSSIVARAEGAGRRMILKRALPRLKVHDEWLSRVERSLIEARCAGVLHDLVPGSVPAVLDIDEHRYAFVMACAPDGSATWKSQLMAGRIDLATAGAAGTLLGRIHARSAEYGALAAAFDDRSFFDELRVDPYLRTVARRHPDLAPQIDTMIAELFATRSCLVHGDFSPKNLLVQPDGALLLLDHEVAHWGNPAFDPAFVLNHLCLKSLKFPERADAYLAAAEMLWTRYLAERPPDPRGTLQAETARLLGGLMLARVDGKSPAEYLVTEAERARARGVARELVAARVSDVLAAFAAVRAGAEAARDTIQDPEAAAHG